MLNAGYTQHMLIDACILYCGKYCTIPECDTHDAVTFDKKIQYVTNYLFNCILFLICCFFGNKNR